MAVDRLKVLLETLEILRSSLREAPADKRASLAAQVRATLVDIEALGGAESTAPAGERTGLIDFQQRLADRESTSKTSRKAAR